MVDLGLHDEFQIDYDPLLHRIRCGAHIIGLSGNDYLFSTDLEAFDVENNVQLIEAGVQLPSAIEMAYWRKKGPAGKLHNLATAIARTSGRLQNWRRCCEVVVPRGNKTRWGSFDKMIEVFLSAKVQAGYDKWLYRFADTFGIDDEDILTPEDLDQLRMIHACLQALRDTGKFLEGPHATIERVIPTFEFLLEHLEKAKVSSIYYPQSYSLSYSSDQLVLLFYLFTTLSIMLVSLDVRTLIGRNPLPVPFRRP